MKENNSEEKNSEEKNKDQEILNRLDNIEFLLKDLLNKISCMRPLVGVDPKTIPRPTAPLPLMKYGSKKDLITNY
jgi:hypothetical protein